MDKTLGQIAFEETDALKHFWWSLDDNARANWEAIAAAVASAVKEEDARICDDLMDQEDPLDPELSYTAGSCAAAIRASIREVK